MPTRKSGSRRVSSVVVTPVRIRPDLAQYRYAGSRNGSLVALRDEDGVWLTEWLDDDKVDAVYGPSDSDLPLAIAAALGEMGLTLGPAHKASRRSR